MMKRNQFFLKVALVLPMLFLSLWSFGQSLTIKGSVKDETNAPLPGVTIMVKGTTTGTIADDKGNYSITAPADAKTLIFSFLGMTSQEVEISGKTQIDVVLASEVKKVDEVVVIGYGTQRKEAVTGSVASMKGETIREVPSSNITQAIQGRIAGVDLEENDSKPGASMQIRIRGVRSLQATNDPLIVLDGIPFAGTINDINPSDIKSLDILKDASATAIYGSRGANGVLMITTFNGQKGQEAHVTYNGYYGLKDIFAKYPMMNGSEFAALRHSANIVKNTIDEADTVNTDWQKELYRVGTVQNHDVSVSGSTDKGHYNFGGAYFKEEAVIPLQSFTRYSLRASIDQEIGKYVRVGLNSTSNYSLSNGFSLGALGTVLAQSPLTSEFNKDGSYKTYYQQATSGAQEIVTKHMLNGLGDTYVDLTRAFGSYNALYGEVKIPGVEGLKYRVNLGLNYRQNNYGNYQGYGLFNGSNPNAPSQATISNELITNWVVENLLSYDHTFAEKHKISAVGLFSSEQTEDFKSQISAKDIPVDQFQFYNMGTGPATEQTIDPGNQFYKARGLQSQMLRLIYSYEDRYMFNVSWRSDGSSVLAPGNKWVSYWGASAGWNMKKESFLKDVAFVDLLKLRVGYGTTSNQGIEPYKTLGLLSTVPYNYGASTYATGLNATNAPNPALGWEYTHELNYAVDFALLKNRITGTIEYYHQNTEKDLLPVSEPPSSGLNGFTANMASVKNNGLELSLNGVILDNSNGLKWEAGANLYLNRNTLTALSGGLPNNVGNNWFVGHPINVIYDYKKIGIWQVKDSTIQKVEQPGANYVGTIRVQYSGGFNTDGTPKRAIDPDDRVIMPTDPSFMGGFNTRIAYKGLDLSIIGTYQHGGMLISYLYGGEGYLNNLNGRSSNNVKVDYWTPTNTTAKFPKPGGPGGDNPQYANSLAYFDASYMKIKTITLGYNISESMLKSAGISNLRVYFTVQNPFVFFSPYKDQSGMDPTTNGNASQNAAVPMAAAGSSNARFLTIGVNTPETRNYLIGINVTF